MTVEEAIQGAKDIIAENISDNANYRKQIKRMCYKDGIITVKGATDEKSTYEMYYNFNEKVNRIPSHRILAINRGEKEEKLGKQTSWKSNKHKRDNRQIWFHVPEAFRAELSH